MSERGLIYILDMESGLSTSLANRVNSMGQHFIYRQWDMTIDAKKEVEAYGKVLRGLVISGSAKNVNSAKVVPPVVPSELLQLGLPTLAICYGMQFLGKLLGVKIVRCFDEKDKEKQKGMTRPERRKDRGEQGVYIFDRTPTPSPLFYGLGNRFPVWMKHSWMLESLPPGWTLTGSTERCPIAAMESGNVFAVQFHPEPQNSLFGRAILHNFFTYACRLETPYF